MADYLSVRPEHIYTTGDSQNDIPMLRMASKSFVPENGRKDVVELADVVVSDNNHCVMRDIVDYLDKVY